MKILECCKTKLGNNIELVGESGDNNVLIIGVFHGDEPQGKVLIERYLVDNSSSSNPLSLPLSRKGRGYNSSAKYTFEKAKELRQNSSDAEQILWQALRRNNINGIHFKRQQPIDRYIVDFVCFSHRLVIELDGGQHNERQNIEYDNKRTNYLESQGFKVIRIWNDEVLNNLDGVIEYIKNSLAPCGRGVGRGGNKSNLLFIPCLNPDGLAKNTRTNANGVDLNRNFPTKNWGRNEGENATCDDCSTAYFGGEFPASEIETQFVISVIEKYSPKLILTIHAPYKVVNYDGPANDIAENVSKIIGYPAEASIGYPTPGSFGTYCGVERNIPTITLELDEDTQIEDIYPKMFEIFEVLKEF